MNSSVECFTSSHLVISLLVFILGALFIGMSILFSIAYVNLRVAHREPLNREMSLIFGLRPFFKALMTLAASLNIYFAGVQLITITPLSFVECIFLIFFNPIYDSQIALCYKLWSTILFWTAATGLLAKYVGGMLMIDGVLFWLFGVPFIIGMITLYHRTTILKKESKVIGSELTPKVFKLHIIETLISLDKYIRRRKHEADLMRSIVQHRYWCKTQSCPLKGIDIKILAHRMDNQNVHSNVLKGLDEVFQQILHIYPKSTEIKLIYIVFLVERLKKYKEALITNTLFEESSSSLEERLILARYKLIIQDKISKKNLQQTDMDIPAIRVLIGIEGIISDFMQLISMTTINKTKIMKELIQEKPDLVKQYELSREFALTLEKLRSFWKQIVKANFADFRLYQIYKKFTSLVLLKTEKANRLTNEMSQEFSWSQKIFSENFSEINKQLPSHLSIAIAGYAHSDSLIYWKVSGQYAAFLGFDERALEKSSIVSIMPNGFSLIHGFIKERIDKLSQNKYESPYFGKNHQIFVRRKTGFIVPALSKVNILSALRDSGRGRFYLHCLQPISEPGAKVDILCNAAFKVTDCSSSALIWMKEVCSHFRLGITTMQTLDPYFQLSQDNFGLEDHRSIILNKRKYSAICRVTNLNLGKYSLFAQNAQLDKQEQQKPYVIYHVKYIIMDTCIAPPPKDIFTKKITSKPPKQNRFVNEDIWAQFNSKFYVEKNDMQRTYMEAWRSTRVFEDTKKHSPINYSSSILTKRLWKGKITDIEKQEFVLQESASLQSQESEPTSSGHQSGIFSSSLQISHLNNQDIPVDIPERIFEQILKKEKANPLHKFFNFIQIVWVTLLLVGIILTLLVWKAYVVEIVGHINDHILITELIEKSTYLNDHLIDLDFLSRNITFRDQNAEYRRQYVSKWTYSLSSYAITVRARLKELQLSYEPSIIRPVFYKVFKSSYLSYPNIFLIAPAQQSFIANLPELPPYDTALITHKMAIERELAKSSPKLAMPSSIANSQSFIRTNYQPNATFITNDYLTDSIPLLKLSADQMFITSREPSLVEKIIREEAVKQFGEDTTVTEDVLEFDKDELEQIIVEEGFGSVG